MRLSRKITTYGKELYNWNFFKIMKGYKLNPGGNWDNLTRVSFGFFDNEPNTKLSENVSALQIYILKASDCNFDNMPVYYDQGPIYRSLEWPNEASTGYTKSRSDYNKIQSNYLYKIEIVNNEKLMITGKNNQNFSDSQYLDLSRIDLPTDECLHYQVIICTLEYLNNINSGCYTPTSIFNGQYYTAYANTIFVDNDVSTEHCFRSWVSSTQDYELQMLSYSNEIQYIPTKEMVVYNTITDVSEYSGRIRYELPNGEDIFCVATQTEPNKSWYYAYNISKADTPLYLLGDNKNNFGDSTTLKQGGFKHWFTINILNTNEPFYVYLTLNNKRYRFLNGLKKSDLCERRSEGGTDISAAFKYGESSEENNTREVNERDPENPVIYKRLDPNTTYSRACFCTFKDTGYSPSDISLVPKEYSVWCRNELIPTILSDSNCTITEIYSPLFYRKKNTDYYREHSYQSTSPRFANLPGLVVDPEEGADWTANGGCILMFEYFDDNPDAIRVFVLADNENNEKIAGSNIFDNDISEIKYTDPNFPRENGKIVGDNVYSPVNYITGDSLQPNSENGGN